MLRFEDAPKKPVNLSLNAEVLAMAQQFRGSAYGRYLEQMVGQGQR